MGRKVVSGMMITLLLMIALPFPLNVRSVEASETSIPADVSNITWLKTIGDENEDSALGIAVDGDSIYITGTKFGAGGYDAFVASLTVPDGSLRWFKIIEGKDEDVVVDVAVAENSVYVAGYTESFGAEGIDAFVACLSASSGELQWFRIIGGTEYDLVDDIAVDGGSVYIAGWTYSFGAGEVDAYVASLSASSGELQWFKTIGGSSWDCARGIDVNGGLIYITGYTGILGEDTDAFVASLTASDGDLLWFRTVGGTGNDHGSNIATDRDIIYITGYTESFGAGSIDAFVASLSASSGNLRWFKAIGETGNEYGPDVAVHADNIYIAGGDGVYAACLGLDGGLEWFRTVGGTSDDSAFSVAIYGENMYIAGETFGFGAGGRDAFVAKFFLDYISLDDPGDMNWVANETWTPVSVDRRDTTAMAPIPTVESYSPSVQSHSPRRVTVEPTSSSQEPEIHTARSGFFDLAIEGVQVSSITPVEGQPVTIRVRIKNYGNTRSPRSMLLLSFNVSYANPIDSGHCWRWTEKAFGSISAGIWVDVEILWNASEIVNAESMSSLCVEISAGGDVNRVNNKVYITEINMTDTSEFDIGVNSYSFSNLEATSKEKGIAIEDMEVYVDLTLELLFPSMPIRVRDAISSYIISVGGDFGVRGYSYGMAATSSKYYAGLLSNPAAKDTFQMLMDESMYEVKDHQTEAVWLGIESWHKSQSGIDLRDEYETIVDLLDEGVPPILILEADDKERLDGQHAVMVYGIYSVSENVKHLLVYDGDYPGVGIIYRFDLENSRIYSETYGAVTAIGRSPVVQADWIEMLVDDLLESIPQMFKGILVFRSPVNVTITDQYGRIVSSEGNEIPGATMEYYSLSDAKVFYLPLDLAYSVRINPHHESECTVTSIMPLSEETAAFTEFSLNLTENTNAQFGLRPGRAGYTVRVDEDGDGTVDYEPHPTTLVYPSPFHDVTVVSATPSSNQIISGESIGIDVIVENRGTETESFNVTVYGGSNIIETRSLSLVPGANATLTFTWGTAEVTPGDYQVIAEASLVPEETWTEDNVKVFDVTVGVSGPTSPWWQTSWPLLAVVAFIAVAVMFIVAKKWS